MRSLVSVIYIWHTCASIDIQANYSQRSLFQIGICLNQTNWKFPIYHIPLVANHQEWNHLDENILKHLYSIEIGRVLWLGLLPLVMFTLWPFRLGDYLDTMFWQHNIKCLTLDSKSTNDSTYILTFSSKNTKSKQIKKQQNCQSSWQNTLKQKM